VNVPADRIAWLGHSTCLIELAGARLITDPLLRRRVAHLQRAAPPVEPPGRVDAVLLSHLHHDHLDMPSLRTIHADVVVVPRGGGRAVRRLRHEVVELGAGEEIAVGATRVLAVPAVHDGRRLPATAEAEAVGFIVTGGPRVYFAGDTELFDAMPELAPCDVALLPVWGWGPKLGPGHMDPEQAAEAAARVRPRIAVPIHWGTFAPGLRPRREPLPDAPARRFAARCAEIAPDVDVRVLTPGGSLAP
jgi:L-ascorbate metabolism protein UlaG (beta-lactamase superfamily)